MTAACLKASLLLLLFMCTGLRAASQHLPFKLSDKKQTIENSPYQTHIRIAHDGFATVGMIIDLYSTDGLTFKGSVTNYTNRYKDSTVDMVVKQTFDKEYSYEIILDSGLCTRVALHLLSTKQDTLSESDLERSKKYTIDDCFSENFEFKVNGYYRRQSIFCPSARTDSTWNSNWQVFRQTINPNIGFLVKELNLDSLKSNFGGTLPIGGCYNYGGAVWACSPTEIRGLTDKEWLNQQRLKAYMDSVNDTLTLYLERRLSEIFVDDQGIDCPNNFYLHFSEKGKLKRISTNSELWKSEEIKRYKHCKQQIFEAFKKIDLSFIKPNHDFEVMLRADRGSFSIYPSRYALH